MDWRMFWSVLGDRLRDSLPVIAGLAILAWLKHRS